MNNSKLRGELYPLLIFVAVDACPLKRTAVLAAIS